MTVKSEGTDVEKSNWTEDVQLGPLSIIDVAGTYLKQHRRKVKNSIYM